MPRCLLPAPRRDAAVLCFTLLPLYAAPLRALTPPLPPPDCCFITPIDGAIDIQPPRDEAADYARRSARSHYAERRGDARKATLITHDMVRRFRLDTRMRHIII